jgi:predicted RNA-binding Zn-ribbon protein involved in translation (DUF1610 family)
LKVENDAILTCTACGVEGPHELLYLSEHMCASRCANCGHAVVYSHSLYADYARDLAGRTSRFPISLASKVFRTPVDILRWPFKAAYKPLGLLKELNYVTVLERGPRRRQRAPDSSRT